MSEEEFSKPETLLCDCGDPNCPGGIPMRAPFHIKAEPLGDDYDDLEFYLSVRTTSWEWPGERTDLHDVFSLLWAAQLRVFEIGSVQLASMQNAFSRIESEIYARILIFGQAGLLAEPVGVRDRFAMLGEASVAAHKLIKDVFAVDSRGSTDLSCDSRAWSTDLNWIEAVRTNLGLEEGHDYEVGSRAPLRWNVFSSLDRGITVAEIGRDSMARLREGFNSFRPVVAEGVESRLFRTDRLVNAVEFGVIEKAGELLRIVNDDPASTICVPTDSHAIFLGNSSIIGIANSGGQAAFGKERLLVEARREKEAAVFLPDAQCIWEDNLNDARFEDLVRALLEQERGIHWVRQVGATREADDGRDLMAEWFLPPRVERIIRGGDNDLLTERHEVLVQIKVRNRGVNRHDLAGIRDTIEHYGCSGLLLVAFPRVTTTLFNHLHELRRRSTWRVDWWGQAEIELRLRKHPEIAARFPDLVRLKRYCYFE